MFCKGGGVTSQTHCHTRDQARQTPRVATQPQREMQAMLILTLMNEYEFEYEDSTSPPAVTNCQPMRLSSLVTTLPPHHFQLTTPAHGDYRNACVFHPWLLP